jgi:acyl carrier protein phosphodiesterase
MTNLKEMNLDGLMNKELVKELWQGVGGQSVKKIALIQKNCNEFKEKYNKLNKMNNKFYPKMTPKCFR